MKKVAFAVAAHPDDIEFMMVGTLLLLKQAGYELHYMNVANGSCGTPTLDRDEIVAIRTQEAKRSAQSMNAVFHPPLVDDVNIFYERPVLARLAAIVRQVRPEILLIPSPQDYMEDHTNTSRLMVTAAFCRGVRNFPTDPPVGPVDTPVALYHALPYGLQDQLRNAVRPEFVVDIGSVLDQKRQALALHRSQKEWLEESQGLDSTLKTMEDLAAQVGAMSNRFAYGEGWQRHSHWGFASEDFDPLTNALNDKIAFITGGRSCQDR